MIMQKIHVIGNKQVCFSKHLHPIRVFKDNLNEVGLDIKYFPSTKGKNIAECDVLIFLEGNYRDILPITRKDRKAAIDYLQCFFSKFKKVIWFDDRDETGNLRTYIFPFINIYAKAQTLVDKTYYQKDHSIGTPHRDFVAARYQVKDAQIIKGLLSDNDLGKIRVSWNLGLVNWVYAIENSPIIKEILLKHRKDYRIEFTSPNLSTRKIHISYRVGMRENIPTVGWWRASTKNEIEEFLNKNPKYKINSINIVNKREYHQEMQNSIVSPSPFGIGEICYRDFECFLNGSLLLKPRMDHTQTWPALYVDGETFIAHAWDFSDFTDKLEDILTHPARYEEVAREGQNRFRQALSDGAGFARHFAEMIA